MDWAPLPATRAPTPTCQQRMHPRPMSACLDTCKHQLASSPASNARPVAPNTALACPGHPRTSRRQERGERSFQQAKKPWPRRPQQPTFWLLSPHTRKLCSNRPVRSATTMLSTGCSDFRTSGWLRRRSQAQAQRQPKHSLSATKTLVGSQGFGEDSGQTATAELFRGE
jgi:hypothetical protein